MSVRTTVEQLRRIARRGFPTRDTAADRIAELEAQLDQAKQLVAMRTRDAADLVAERDRLKAQLTTIGELMNEMEDGGFAPTSRRAWAQMVEAIQAALSPSPSVKP